MAQFGCADCCRIRRGEDYSGPSPYKPVNSPSPHPYARKVVEQSDNLLIESRCALCGFRIVGSVTRTLRQDEDDHAARCPKRQAERKAAS